MRTHLRVPKSPEGGRPCRPSRSLVPVYKRFYCFRSNRTLLNFSNFDLSRSCRNLIPPYLRRRRSPAAWLQYTSLIIRVECGATQLTAGMTRRDRGDHPPDTPLPWCSSVWTVFRKSLVISYTFQFQYKKNDITYSYRYNIFYYSWRCNLLLYSYERCSAELGQAKILSMYRYQNKIVSLYQYKNLFVLYHAFISKTVFFCF